MLLELFVTFFKLGLFTIGGGVAMIPILRDKMVNEKQWFTDEEMVDLFAVCQGLPGVIAINMATYVGFKRRGFLGSLVSTVGVILPSFVIILLIAQGLAAIGDNPIIMGALGGLRAAAVGLIIVAVWQVARTVMKGPVATAGAVLSFVLIAFLHVNVAYVVLAALIAGIVIDKVRGQAQ
ncbi:MAG: chromate transporter [Mogibacterium sp.]|nr:chromate transporter [Mogibacterium sp.]